MPTLKSGADALAHLHAHLTHEKAFPTLPPGSSLQLAFLSLTVTPAWRAKPDSERVLPLPGLPEAEPILCDPEDEAAGFSLFTFPDLPDRVLIPLFVYDEAALRAEFLDPVRADPAFAALTDWVLELAPPLTSHDLS
jgi:hypothetical protein